GPVRVDRLHVAIDQQREVQRVLLGERLMALTVVCRYSVHHGAKVLKPRQRVAEAARFLGAARRIVLRIEVHDSPRTAAVLQPPQHPCLILQRETRRFLTDVQHASSPPGQPYTWTDPE